ncbi:MAG TPA: NAD(+) diphosphatase [Sphingomicrobium sp.]|nr:NAD(+) diphosphatase [Sphingomicrobium sp.]
MPFDTSADLPPEIFFSGAGLDRADALRGLPESLAAMANRDDARELDWDEGLPSMDESGRLQWKKVTDASLFLGLEGGAPRFSALVEAPGAAFGVLPLIAGLDSSEAPIFAAALSLSRWHHRHRFCANCGHPTEIVRGGWSRACPSCSAEHFPRVDPVAIMLVEHEGKVLLGRQPHYPPGRYSALAGFIEVGECLEDAVAREVKEEAGIDVRNIQYVASQPWPFPSSLMIGCHAEATSSALTIDTNELEDARWFTREEIGLGISGVEGAPFQPPPRTAIARALLERWLAA